MDFNLTQSISVSFKNCFKKLKNTKSKWDHNLGKWCLTLHIALSTLCWHKTQISMTPDPLTLVTLSTLFYPKPFITWLRIIQKPHLFFTNTGKPHFNYRFWSMRRLFRKDNLRHRLGGRGEQHFIRRLLGQPRRMKSCGLFYWCFNKVEMCTLGVSRAVRLEKHILSTLCLCCLK